VELPWCYKDIVCCDCGKKERRGYNAKRCTDCQRRHSCELHLEAQRWRRAKKSGRLFQRRPGDIFSGWVPARFKCRCCARKFIPRRATAVFCSTRCRVFWHRQGASGGSAGNRSG
jgi:hypothetical protein